MGYRKKSESVGSSPHEREFGKNILTLVIYSSHSSNQLPKIKQVILPNPREVVVVDDSHTRKPEIRATITEDFDDEKLIRFLTASYRSLRGPLRVFASARTLVFLHLVSYTDIYALRASPLPPPPAALHGDDVTGIRLQRLFEKPRTGYQQHELVDFVHQLPENSEHDPQLHTSEHVAIQFIEGWSVRRIASAIFVVMLAAVLVTILWTTVGMEASFVPTVGGFGGGDVGSGNGTGEGLFSGGTTREMIAGGFHGVGTRAGTGMLLGMLVLALGWTAVVGWIGLSWLVG